MASFRVEADRLFTGFTPVSFVEANAYDRRNRISPRCIVLHDTAGWLTPLNSVAWFKSKSCTTSAHVVLERDGSATQMVEFDRRAYHAGKSSFKGKSDVNWFSIGIEIVNPGVLTKEGKAWFHKKAADYFAPSEIAQKTTKEHGPGYWLPYTSEQIDAVIAMCRALVKAYPTIADITTHYEISPGRKADVNPLFPIERVRAAVFGKGDEPAPVSNLEFGVKGDDVRKIQERLLELGYQAGCADGEFGPRTRSAVLAFEAENALATDGVLTEHERSVLLSDAAKPMPVPSSVSVTATELAERGSRIVKITQFGKMLIRRALTFLGISTATDQLVTGGENVTAVLDQADKVRTVASRSFDLLGWLKSDLGLAVFCAGLIALGIYALLEMIEKFRVDDARQGKNVAR